MDGSNGEGVEWRTLTKKKKKKKKYNNIFRYNTVSSVMCFGLKLS